MASINATTSSGIVATADNTGQLALQAAGTTVMTITSTGVTTQVGAPAFSAYSLVAQVTSASTTTKIQLNTERFDTNNNFDSTTNYRFTPTIAGYYQISAAVTYTNNVNNYGAGAIIYKNGSNYAWGTATGTGQMYATAQVSSLIYLNGSTDYIELYVYNGSGASQTTGADPYYTYMTGFLARSA